MQNPGTFLPLVVAAVLALSACGGGSDDPAADTGGSAPGVEESASNQDGGTGHGAVQGAEEVAEPQLRLVSIASDGAVGMVDLLDGTESEPGRIAPPSAVTSDGRYLFAETADGVEIVDSGVWTWDHGDHSHYYRTAPDVLGPVAGSGPVVVATSGNATSGSTGLFFGESGEAVLLDNEALSRGEVRETFRVGVAPHTGLAAPLGRGALITSPDQSGAASEVRFHDSDGVTVDGATERCPQAGGTIATRVGVVVGCADGAVLATLVGDEPQLEHIPHPGAVGERATDFRNRKGRPTVAALAGDTGFWLLDTRAREWTLVPTGQTLVRVSAAGDEDAHVIAVDRQGRIRVYDGGTGAELASSDALLAEAVAHPATLAGVDLVVDRERAYVNDPVAGVVHEIDYRGDARIARTLTTPTTPDFFSETGR